MFNWLKRLFGYKKNDVSKQDEIRGIGAGENTGRVPIKPQDAAEMETRSYSGLPEFESMTKLEIDIWARKELKLKLDRRYRKSHMVNEIKKHIKGE